MTLVLLAINVLAMLAVVAVLVLHRRAVSGRRDAFKGRVRVVEGEVEGVSDRWHDGYARWVRDVLVWSEAPFFIRTQLIPIDGTDTAGIHANGDIGGLGKRPVVVPLLVTGGSRLELATAEADRDLALGPFARTSAVGSLVQARFASGGAFDPNDN